MKKFISDPRLNTYKSLLRLKTDEEALRAYYWNKALSGALYPALQALEVTLRNALNEAVKNYHTGAYANDDWWFEHIATDVQNNKIRKMPPVKKKHWLKTDRSGATVRRRHSYFEQQVLKTQRDLRSEGRTPIRHDDVLSRLMFGFWCGLLGDDFEDVTNKALLWPNLLKEVFPNTPYKPKRHQIEKTLNRVRDLRNRLSHHEPIWKFYHLLHDGSPDYSNPVWGLTASLGLLEKNYNDILEFIRWISQERYNAFIDAKMDVEFRKLCSQDGFYSYVDKSQVEKTVGRSRFKREAHKHVKSIQEAGAQVIAVTRASKTQFVLGVNEPKVLLD
ncbi:Abi family protein [Vibrio vulnificus]|nr:Abi family protein [Vibrio vulnificus]MCU8150212.1 Abi family protein [Vibrio vulnificus]MCU8385892.1 Abi family protein [Vibrio vulnificus]